MSSSISSFVGPTNISADIGWGVSTAPVSQENKALLEPGVFLGQSFSEAASSQPPQLLSKFNCISGPAIHLTTGDEIKGAKLKGIYVSLNTDVSALEKYILEEKHGDTIMADIERLKAQGIRHPKFL